MTPAMALEGGRSMDWFFDEWVRGTGIPHYRVEFTAHREEDRKSTRLNSSHSQISYAVFCLKKKNETASCTVRLHAARAAEHAKAAYYYVAGLRAFASLA